jgi:1-deoxy-D-xylulose-5-phosphate reductoisomerase
VTAPEGTTLVSMRRIIVLGSTGSIGVNTLDVAARLGPAEIEVVGLAAHRRIERLREQAERWRPRFVAVTDPEAHAALASTWDRSHGTLLRGPDGVAEMIREAGADLVMQAMVGAAGLPAALATVERGLDLAVANKESLVIAGPLLLGAAERSGSRLLPVDSEHSAIFQALGDEPTESVRRILLTASGGPFRTTPAEALASITPKEALDHPVWKMGPKITVDSATMMNKALEIVEAHWLFGLETDRIEIVVHPQGVVHSMVEFRDGNVLAQLGPPDMRIPIQYALTYPRRLPGPCEGFGFERFGRLVFEPPDFERFPALRLGYEAAERGGTYGAALNAANEIAVDAFLAGRISFPGIHEQVERAVEEHAFLTRPGLEDLLETDREVRRRVRERIDGR